MRLALLTIACGALTGCGYADFQLPHGTGGDRSAGFTLQFHTKPVLVRGAPGQWDSHDALNPSVVAHAGALYNFYSGFDGATWHTGLALSTDGLRWSKQGRVLSPDPQTWEGSYIAANGAALFQDGEFVYWYQAGAKNNPRLGLARSRDGRQWRKHPAPVLGYGPRGSWDERALGDPYVIRFSGTYYLYYLGEDRARRQRIGLARSTDGIHWEKLRSNPLMELGGPGAFDEDGLGEPAVWLANGWYWMLYTGRDRAGNRRLGLARSADGVAWERLPAVFSGTQAWNRSVIADATVEALGPSLLVWFGGGDRASPDENLNGQIGVATLLPVHASLTK